jgi:hypothetical protein
MPVCSPRCGPKKPGRETGSAPVGPERSGGWLKPAFLFRDAKMSGAKKESGACAGQKNAAPASAEKSRLEPLRGRLARLRNAPNRGDKTYASGPPGEPWRRRKTGEIKETERRSSQTPRRGKRRPRLDPFRTGRHLQNQSDERRARLFCPIAAPTTPRPEPRSDAARIAAGATNGRRTPSASERTKRLRSGARFFWKARGPRTSARTSI